MKWVGPALLYVGLPLLLAEVTEVAPWLAGRLLRWASRLLPMEHRERYELEWLGELDEVPGKLFKLLFAARIALRAPATKRELELAQPFWVRLIRLLLDSVLTGALAVARVASRLMPKGRATVIPLPHDESFVRNEAAEEVLDQSSYPKPLKLPDLSGEPGEPLKPLRLPDLSGEPDEPWKHLRLPDLTGERKPLKLPDLTGERIEEK